MNLQLIDNSVAKFINRLEKSLYAKTLRSIDLLERFAYKLCLPHSKKVAKNLFELRVRGKKEIRIFYTFHKRQIFLLHCFIKKSQKIPQRDIKTTLQKLKYLTNK